MAQQHTAFFVLDRETKGALRYQETSVTGKPVQMADPSCIIGTLYLRKASLGGSKPQAFTITIDDVEEVEARRVA